MTDQERTNGGDLTAALVEVLINDVLTDALADAGLAAEVLDASTYAQAGVMTTNDGLVVRLSDGTEFQLTVVQSR